MAQRKKPKYTSEAVYEQYKHERRRIQSYISKMKKAGYNVEDFTLPSIPKEIKEGSVNKLKKLTPSKIRESLYYISPYTGAYADASNRYRSRKLMAEDRVYSQYDSDIETSLSAEGELEFEEVIAVGVINGFRNQIKNLNNETAYNIINEWLDSWMYSAGEVDVSRILIEAAKKGIVCTVNEGDSWRTAKDKSLRFIEQLMVLSGEYTPERAGEVAEEFIYDNFPDLT